MKLAEALTESKRLGNLIPALLTEFNDNCVTINGVKPDRDPEKITHKIMGTLMEKGELDRRLSFSNTMVKIPMGLTIHGAILRKTVCKAQINTLNSMLAYLKQGKRIGYEERGQNIVKAFAVKPDALESERDKAAQELRTIEAQLQQVNWLEDLR